MEVPFGNNVSDLDKPVGKGGLAVIDMGDYAKIAYLFYGCYCGVPSNISRTRANSSEGENGFFRMASAVNSSST